MGGTGERHEALTRQGWLRAGEGNEPIKTHEGNTQVQTIRVRAGHHRDRKCRDTTK